MFHLLFIPREGDYPSCVHRIDAGLAPACVTTCTGKALNYESDFDEDLSGAAAPDGFASASYTLPAVRFST